MPRRLITSGSPFEKAASFSRAVVDGEWIFISGTTGYDYATMTIAADVETQTRLVSGLSEEEKAALNTLLGKYLSDFETALEKSAAV